MERMVGEQVGLRYLVLAVSVFGYTRNEIFGLFRIDNTELHLDKHFAEVFTSPIGGIDGCRGLASIDNLQIVQGENVESVWCHFRLDMFRCGCQPVVE